MPVLSTASGFSQKMCFLASTAAQMLRTEVRRGAEQYDIDTAIENFLISIEADKRGFRRHRDPIHQFAPFESTQTFLDAVREGVAHGGQCDIGIGKQGIFGSAVPGRRSRSDRS